MLRFDTYVIPAAFQADIFQTRIKNMRKDFLFLLGCSPLLSLHRALSGDVNVIYCIDDVLFALAELGIFISVLCLNDDEKWPIAGALSSMRF